MSHAGANPATILVSTFCERRSWQPVSRLYSGAGQTLAALIDMLRDYVASHSVTVHNFAGVR